MSDSLKTFIQQHRSEFDAAFPGKENWSGVERAIARLKTADGLERTLLFDRLLLDTAQPDACVWEQIASTLDGQAIPADNLECFIRQHRDELDHAVPDLRVWDSIEQALPPAVRRLAKIVQVDWQRSLLRVAASIALVLTGVGMGLWYARSTDVSPENSGMAMSDVSAEYRELEDFYRRDIAVKEEKLAQFASNRPDDIEGDLAQMDKVMAELRRELADVPPGNREQVVRAMIENYQAKSAILQRVLQHLETLTPDQQQNSTQHEKARI